MDKIYFVFFMVISFAILFDILIKPFLEKRGVAVDIIEMIEYAVDLGVSYAEQEYKENQSTDRYSLALDYIFMFLDEVGIVPERYLELLEGFIKDAIRRLPKTHDENGNVIV